MEARDVVPEAAKLVVNLFVQRLEAIRHIVEIAPGLGFGAAAAKQIDRPHQR